MLKHMLNTSLIVVVIYIGLLFIIKHPFAMALVNDAAKAEEISETANINSQSTTALVANTEIPKKVSVANAEKINKSQVIKQQAITTKQERQATLKPVTSKKVIIEQPITLVGITERIAFNSPEQISSLWQRFQDNTVLQNNVKWHKAPIKMYAYYANFSSDFSQADLSIAYNKKDLMLNSDLSSFTLPQQNKQEYAFKATEITPSNEVWATAYQHGNLLEVYELDDQGNTLTKKAIIFQ